MKNDEVILGGKYFAKVSGNLVEVRIDAVGRHGGWSATNLATNKTIHIKSAQRLRSARGTPAKKGKPVQATPATDECPRGGKHEWTTEDGERYCSKCIETAPKKKPAKAPKLAIYVARPKGNAAKEAMDQVARDTAERSAKAAAEKTDATTTEPDAKKLSAINAAAKVLAESGQPMNAKEMIDAMTSKGYWTSPGGKTPHATLYSAIIREISLKGDASRFAKTERGKFTFNANANANT